MEEKKSPSTFYKVTALLCALVMLFGVIAFFSGDLTARTKCLKNQIDNKEQQIEQTQKRIGQLEEDVAKYQREKKARKRN